MLWKECLWREKKIPSPSIDVMMRNMYFWNTRYYVCAIEEVIIITISCAMHRESLIKTDELQLKSVNVNADLYLYMFYCHCEVVYFSLVFNNSQVIQTSLWTLQQQLQIKAEAEHRAYICKAINLCKIYECHLLWFIHLFHTFFSTHFAFFLHHQINYLFNAHKNVVMLLYFSTSTHFFQPNSALIKYKKNND